MDVKSNNSFRAKIIWIWLPVILLPVINLLTAFATHQRVWIRWEWILGAVLEEVIYRGVILQAIFLKHCKAGTAVLLSGTIFAAAHILNLQIDQTMSETLLQVVVAFCFSIWAGASTANFNIFPAVAAHVLMNATSADGMSLLAGLLICVVCIESGYALLGWTDKDKTLCLFWGKP